MKKKLISLVLVLALVFSNATFALAAENDYLTEEPKVKISKEMSGKTALTHIGDENAIFLDLRAAEDYAAGHIKGTISAPVCLSASEGYKVPVANKEAFVAQMKELQVVEKNTKIYLHCYMGTFCVNYAADWLLEDVGVKNSQLVRVLKGTFGDANLAAASNFTYLDSALAAAEAGTGLILDLRATDVYYANGYLDGSLHQPVFGANGVTNGKDDLAKEFTAFVKANKALLTSKNVYLLCNSGASGAEAATKLLKAAGISKNVFTIEGGAKELKAKHPELMVNQNTKTADETVAVSGTSTVPSANTDKVVILDVRTTENYNIGHVKGAISAPVFAPSVTNGYDDTAKAFLATVEANKEKIADKDIYIVCNSGNSGAKAATKLLMQAGYSNAKIFTVTGGAKELAPYQTFVSPAQALSAVGAKDYVIIDVRANAKYEVGHLNKSVHLPLFGEKLTTGSDELADAFNAYVDNNRTDLETKKIYILCNSGESIAREASKLLAAKGLTNFYTIDGGAAALAGNLTAVKPDYALAKVAEGGLVLDVRATDTFFAADKEDSAEGYLDGSLHQPLFDANGVSNGVDDQLAKDFLAFVEANKDLLASKNIYILCNSGSRGAEAAHKLFAAAGINGNVYTIEGGAAAIRTASPELLVNQNKKTAEETIAVSGTSTEKGTNSAVIIDVRTVENYNVGHVKGAISAPLFTSKGVSNGYDATAKAFLATVEANKEKIADKDIYIVCNSGARGAQAATKLLMQAGYANTKIFTVTGGAKELAPWQTFVSPAQAASVVKKTTSYVIFDVRANEKVADGSLSGSVHLPLYGENGLTTGSDELAEAFKEYVTKNKKTLSEKKIYILCNSGESIAREASKLLAAEGFTNFFTIDGGAGALADKLVKPTAPSKVSLSDSTYTFNGKEKKPTVTVRDKKGDKISSKYYTVEYTDNVNAGKGTVTVTFKGKYGSFAPMTRTITISKAKSTSIKLMNTSFVYTGEEIIPEFKTSAGLLLDASNYTIVSVKNNVNVGKATIKVKFQGNVSSVTKTYTYKINPVGTELTEVTPGKTSFTAKWKEQPEQITGYQVRYSRYSSFKKYSTKSVSSKYLSKQVTGLTKNKTYYVKVRTYKTKGDTKYYSGWSEVVKVKTGTTPVSTKATLADVKAALTDTNAVVLDARTQDAYAGWSTENNKLGGHINGASGFSAAWLTCAYNDASNNDNRTREERLAIAMEDKGIAADTKVIVYDENGKDAAAVAEYLSKKGVKDIKTFNLADWDGELVKYANYQTMLPPSVVKKLIDGETVAEIGEVKDLKILEFSWGTEEQSGYLDGHVPTAIHINSDDVDDENYIYILDKDEILIETMKNAGITVDSTVVVTGEGLFACHLATILKYLGVEDVYIMSGGANGWTNAGYEAETKSNTPVAVEDFGTDTPLNPNYIDDVEEVTALLTDSNAQVVDTRAYKEYVGEFSGYGYVYSAGRLGGAIFGQEDGSAQGPNCNGSSMMYYENIDGTMRDASEILEMWSKSGVDVNKHLSFYCGGGYRAAAVMWYAQAMGLENTSLYNDGWAGWIVYRKDAVKGTYENPQPAEYNEADPDMTKPN